jgi:hypothetical protein
MRAMKLALVFGLLSVASYGCGDGGEAKKNDAAPPTGTNTSTNTTTTTTTNTSTSTTTGTPTATNTTTATSTATVTNLDAGSPDTAPVATLDGGGDDGPLAPALDGGASPDGGTVTPAVDGGTVLDGAIAVDGGAPLDAGAAADAPLASDGPAGDAPSTTGNCNYPQCYIDIFTDCAPSGACVIQTTAGGLSSITTNICFENGIKEQSLSTFSIDIGSGTMTGTTVSTWKNAGGVCYTIEEPYSSVSLTSLTQTYKNPSGAALATVTIDTVAGTQTITCTGQAPVVVATNCGSADTDAGSTPACTTGTCAF